MKKVLFIAVLVFSSVLLYADLSITPAVINIVANDEAVCESVYKVFNTADTKTIVKISMEDWKNSSKNSSDVTVEKWLNLPKTEIEIEPKSEVEVPFRIETFKGMVGSVSGMVVFSSNKTNMINMTMKVPIYIIIEGTEIVDFKIDSLKITGNKDTGTLSTTVVIKNDGNVHIRHTGNIKLYDTETGDMIKKIEIEETFPTYCESSREFIMNIAAKDELKQGFYLAVFEIKALGRSVHKSIRFKVSKDGNIEVKK